MASLGLLPNSIIAAYAGIGFRNLIPSEYDEYLNPANHKYSFSKGNIDISSDSNSLSFDIQNLEFAYDIPAYKSILASSAAGYINAKVRLIGNVNDVAQGKYNKISIDGNINSAISILGKDTPINEKFKSDLDLDINGNFTISKDKTSLDAKQVSVRFKYN